MDLPTPNRDKLISKWEHILEWTDHVFTWTSGHELAFLCEVAEKSTSICEVGSYHGKSALAMALANPNCRIHCIDVFDDAGSEDMFKQNLTLQMNKRQVLLFRDNSDVIQSFAPDITFDACFIDGGHLYADVLKDIENIRPRMRPGGVMMGHDWRHDKPLDGVNRAVEASFEKYSINVFESIWYVKLP